MSKNVYVFAEQRDGVIQKVAYELVGKARELADTLDEKVYAVLVGQDMNPCTEKAQESVRGHPGGSDCRQRLLQREEPAVSEREWNPEFHQTAGSRKTESPCLQGRYWKVLQHDTCRL